MNSRLAGACALLLSAMGCSSELIEVLPATLSFGEVDFQQSLPPEGYNAQSLTITNLSRSSLQVQIHQLDSDVFLLSGPLESSDPPTLSAIDPEGRSVVSIGIHGYALGQRDTEVSGAFEISTSKNDNFTLVPWTFTPIRNIQ